MSTETKSSTEISPIEISQTAPGYATVWLRKNIQKTTETQQMGEDSAEYPVWIADEVCVIVTGQPTESDIEARFDELWDSSLTVDEKIEQLKATVSYVAAMTEVDL